MIKMTIDKSLIGDTTHIIFSYDSGRLMANYSPNRTKGLEHARDVADSIHTLVADVNATLIARGHSGNF